MRKVGYRKQIISNVKEIFSGTIIQTFDMAYVHQQKLFTSVHEKDVLKEENHFTPVHKLDNPKS